VRERSRAMASRSGDGTPETERLQSVRRALAVLEALATRPAGVTPKELGQMLGLHLSTSYRLLNTLVDAGYAVRGPSAGIFRLGPRVAFLHHGYLAAVTPPPHALAFVHALQQATGETAMLNRLEGDDVTSVAVVAGSRAGSHPSGYIGMAAPAHAVAAGKVLLAWLPPTALDAYLDRRSREAAPLFPLTHPDAFRTELARIREAGFAVDRGGERRETCCVAAPVTDHDGTVAAAISVVVPCSRFPQDEQAMVTSVRAVADALAAFQTAVSGHTEWAAPGDGEASVDQSAAVASALASLAEAMSRVG
jgi:DNA-binding IclR family transcriptional regulator